MLTLYYAPKTRATRILWLIEQMGIRDQIELKVVGVSRQDGSGGHDPDNPHPEGKVPLLVHDGAEIRESNAIMLYLTDLFPDGGMGPQVGDADRGAYLGWLAYYGNVVEPVIHHRFAGLDLPLLKATFRGPEEMDAEYARALNKGDWILGDRLSAADLLCVSPFTWMPDLIPDAPAVRAWVDRCTALPSFARASAFDDQHAG